MSFIESIKNFIKRREILSHVHKRYYELTPTPRVLEVVPEAIKRENIDLKSKIVVLQSKLNKSLKKDDYDEQLLIDNEILKQRNQLAEDDKNRKVDIGLILKQINEGKKIKVFSKDLRFLGELKTLAIGKNKLLEVVCKIGNEEFIVAKGNSIEYLIHYSESISDQLNKGILILNRYYDGFTIPDLEVPTNYDKVLTDDEAQSLSYIPVEKKIKDLSKTVNNYYEKIETLEKVNTKLTNENKDLRMSNDVNKTRADSAEASFLNALTSLKSYINHINGLSLDQYKNVAVTSLAEQSEKYHQEVADKAIKELANERTKTDFDVGLDKIQRSLITVVKAKDLVGGVNANRPKPVIE
jgi:hypothetical protein